MKPRLEMPEKLSVSDLERLLRLAKRDGRTIEEVSFAVESVRAWAVTNNRLKADWPLTIINAMRRGWALTNIAQWLTTKKLKYTIRGSPVLTKITDEVIYEWLERARKDGCPE